MMLWYASTVWRRIAERNGVDAFLYARGTWERETTTPRTPSRSRRGSSDGRSAGPRPRSNRTTPSRRQPTSAAKPSKSPTR